MEAINEIERKLLEIVKKDLPYDEAFKMVNSFFAEFASKFNIAYVNITNSGQESVFSKKTITEVQEIYKNGNEIDDECFKITRNSGPNKTIEFQIYPTKGYKFTEEEILSLEYILSILFTYISRSRYAEVLGNVYFQDPLTGGPNTPAITRFLGQLKGRNIADQYAVMFCNLKGFNAINQSLGSGEADILIKKHYEEVVKYLESDEMVARPGGDNLIIAVKKENLPKVLDNIKQIKLMHNNREFVIDSWISYNEILSSDPVGTFITYANEALGIAKRKLITVPYTLSAKERMEVGMIKKIIEIIPNAIQDKELIPFYQPKVGVNNRKLVGAEALVRWYNEGKQIPPSLFIPILERKNEVSAVDFYMLERVCEDLREWLNKGLIPVRTSVNFSRNHVYSRDTAKRIVDTINRYNIDPRFIEIELTESSNSNNIYDFIYLIKELRAHGICVSMDDFGTGYNGIELLKSVSYDVVKLDKSIADLIDHETDDVRKLIIVKHIIEMLKDLDVEIVAEGVEKENQLSALRNLGVDVIQGYYFDKPLEHDEFQKRLINRQY